MPRRNRGCRLAVGGDSLQKAGGSPLLAVGPPGVLLVGGPATVLQALPGGQWLAALRETLRALAKLARTNPGLVASVAVPIIGFVLILWVVVRRIRGSSGSRATDTGPADSGDGGGISLDEVDDETFQLAQQILEQEGRERSREQLAETIEQVQAVQTADATEFRLGLVSDEVEQKRADRNVVAPGSFTPERTYFQRGDTYVRILAPAQLPDSVMGGWLIPLQTRGLNCRVSYQFQPRDPTSIRGQLQQRLTHLTTDISKKQQKGRTDVHQEKQDRQAIDRLLTRLSAGDTKLFDLGIYLEVYGETVDELDEETRKVSTLMAERGAKVTPLEYQQMTAQAAVAPVAKPRSRGRSTHLLEAEAAATTLNWVEPAVTDAEGIFLGFDETSQPVIVDRWQLSSFTKIISGMIGSGKSFSASLSLYLRMIADPAYRALIFDPAGDDFIELTRALGGQVVEFGGDTIINPMELRQVGEQIDDPLQHKLRSLTGIMQTYFDQTGTALSAEAEGLLQNVFKLAYLQYGITGARPTHDRVSPTFLDVIELVDALAAGEDLADTITFAGDATDLPAAEQQDLQGQINRIVERFGKKHRNQAENLQLALEGFRPPGGPASNLTGHTNVDLSSRMVCFDLSTATQDAQSAPVMLYVMLEWAFMRASQDTRPIEVMFEESHYLLNNRRACELLALFTRHSRHFSAGLTLISQGVDDFMVDPDDQQHTPLTIFQNADIKQLFHIESVPDEATDYLDLTQGDINFIEGAAKGQQTSSGGHDTYSECLLLVSGVGRRQLRIQVPDFFQDLLDNPLEADAAVADQLGMEPGAARDRALGTTPASASAAPADDAGIETAPERTDATTADTAADATGGPEPGGASSESQAPTAAATESARSADGATPSPAASAVDPDVTVNGGQASPAADAPTATGDGVQAGSDADADADAGADPAAAPGGDGDGDGDSDGGDAGTDSERGGDGGGDSTGAEAASAGESTIGFGGVIDSVSSTPGSEPAASRTSSGAGAADDAADTAATDGADADTDAADGGDPGGDDAGTDGADADTAPAADDAADGAVATEGDADGGAGVDGAGDTGSGDGAADADTVVDSDGAGEGDEAEAAAESTAAGATAEDPSAPDDD